VGPGQELGRALDRIPNRVEAYTVNILGSLSGIVLFAACSWAELSPFWWFLAIVAGLGYFLFFRRSSGPPARRWSRLAFLAGILVVASLNTGAERQGGRKVGEHLWSPYYRIDYRNPPERSISVNLIGHQAMVTTGDGLGSGMAYELPYLFERDAGARPFQDALVIGAGSGNDVSRALQWGARHVDAVEIDPVILSLGRRDHPDRPYQDSRVTTHLDDGRNFLRSTHGQYDLIVYALVDSLVLHSSFSDIRLESFLFTREALADVRRHLRPGGLFVMYNFFRQGWIVGRLDQQLTETFGSEPLVMNLPYRETIEPDTAGGFTMFMSGETGPLRQAFEKHPAYRLHADQPAGPLSPNGFELDPSAPGQGRLLDLGLSRVVLADDLRGATDDWPFLYVRRRTIPNLSLGGAGTMGGLAILLLFLFLRQGRKEGKPLRFDGRMFFLGAGFMLLETEAVVHMALLFGSTWMVNTVVFMAVLVMILGANLFVLQFRPRRLWPYYAGLLAALALNILIPLDAFLGINRSLQVLASCLLVFTPVLFAGVIFAVAFSHSSEPDQDFGANVGGAILGGLSEYSSTLLGFQYLTLLAVVFYVLSSVFAAKRAAPTSA
jgi:SAM-dependent methyltransferase